LTPTSIIHTDRCNARFAPLSHKSMFLPIFVDEEGSEERTEKWNQLLFGCINIVEPPKSDKSAPMKMRSC